MNPEKKQRIKEVLKKIVTKETIYKGNLGIAELMRFYGIADPDSRSKVDSLFAKKQDKTAWHVVVAYLKSHGMLKENWKGALAGLGIAGLSAITPNTTHDPKPLTGPIHAKSTVTTHVHRPPVYHKHKNIITLIKHYENNKENPNSGYNKEKQRWYPHKSVEGGSDTIAYGHKIQPHENFSKGLSDVDAIRLLRKDIARKEEIIRSDIPNFDKFPEYIRNALVNAFYRGDMEPNVINLINRGQWDKVASAYLNNKNFKSGDFQQIKDRMQDNANAFISYAQETQR
jgi:hypothetical protein